MNWLIKIVAISAFILMYVGLSAGLSSCVQGYTPDNAPRQDNGINIPASRGGGGY